MRVLEVCEWWKQGEWLEDAHWVAEAARARAATEKEHREVEEQSRKCHRLEEEEAEASMSIECCKRCITKCKPVHSTLSLC